VSLGDSFTFSITVDNDGSTTASQTWTYDDFVSIKIDVNDGAYVGLSSDIAGGSTGTFATDGMSDVIAAPTSWLSTSDLGADSQPLGGFDWIINGANAIWFGSVQPPYLLDAVMGSANTDEESWTLLSESNGGGGGGATPEPSTFVLAVLGLVGLTLGRRPRRRRG
jgi:hypothetical protein